MEPADRQRFERFTILWTGIQPRVHGYLLTFTQNLEAARDLNQEVAVILWRKFDGYQDGTSFFAWAAKIARFEAMNWRRRHHRRCVQLSDDILDMLAAEAESVGEGYCDRTVALRSCLDTLPERQRKLIAERYTKRQPVGEIAGDQGSTASAIYKSLNRVHRALGKCINAKLSQASA